VLAVKLGEFSAEGDAVELLEEFAALAPAAEAQLADKLLVAGFLAGGAADVADKFAVSHQIQSRTFSGYDLQAACGWQ
jgi:hypothetical protein